MTYSYNFLLSESNLKNNSLEMPFKIYPSKSCCQNLFPCVKSFKMRFSSLKSSNENLFYISVFNKRKLLVKVIFSRFLFWRNKKFCDIASGNLPPLAADDFFGLLLQYRAMLQSFTWFLFATRHESWSYFKRNIENVLS